MRLPLSRVSILPALRAEPKKWMDSNSNVQAAELGWKFASWSKSSHKRTFPLFLLLWLLLCNSEYNSSVKALQCLWIILRHDFWKDFCLFSFGWDIYLYICWWWGGGGGLIYKPQAKCHLVPLYLKECRHLCSSQLLFPQLKPKQSSWINSTTGNIENV